MPQCSAVSIDFPGTGSHRSGVMMLRPVIGAGVLAAVLSLSVGRTAMAQCTFSESSVPLRPVLVYRFRLHPAGDSTSLGITVQFPGSMTGLDTLGVPSQWAGERNHSMRDLHPVTSGVEIETIPGRDARLVRHAPGATVVLSYELIKDWIGPLDHPHEFHPIVFPDYIEFTADNALVHPRYGLYTPVIVHFDWSGVPASWTLATSFGTTEGAEAAGGVEAQGKGTEHCQTYIGVWRDVFGGLYAAGDFRVHRFTILGEPAVLAIRGTWRFSDSEVIAEVQRDVGVVREFWHDKNFPYFLVTWAPFGRDHGSGDGSAFTNGLWIFMSRLDSLQTQITQLTHESFHEWDPRRMGRIPPGEERHLGWFHEGFTTYYADVIAYRAGLITLDAVVKRANRDIRNFPGSTDPYTRGDVIARWLDGEIRESSKGRRSLDDFMRDMVRGADQPLTVERVLSTADRYLPSRDRSALRDMATATGRGAQTVPDSFSAAALAPCARVTLDSVYTFDAGFDVFASVAARRTIGVRAGSAAYAAGLRDSEPLLGWTIYNGDSEREAHFTVKVDTVRERITYYPRGAGAVAPQLHIIEGYTPPTGSCGRTG